MTITKYWTIETNDYDDVLVEVIIPDPFASTEATQVAQSVQQTLEIDHA
jgi:hypothetical protein